MGKLVATPTPPCEIVGMVAVPVELGMVGSSSTAGTRLVDLFAAVEEFGGWRNA